MLKRENQDYSIWAVASKNDWFLKLLQREKPEFSVCCWIHWREGSMTAIRRKGRVNINHHSSQFKWKWDFTLVFPRVLYLSHLSKLRELHGGKTSLRVVNANQNIKSVRGRSKLATRCRLIVQCGSRREQRQIGCSLIISCISHSSAKPGPTCHWYLCLYKWQSENMTLSNHKYQRTSITSTSS